MSCSLKLYEHENYGGDHTHRTTTFTSTDDGNSGGKMSRIADRDSSGKVSGPCAWVVMQHPKGSGGGGFVLDPNENAPSFHNSNHHGEGKGSTNQRWYKRGDQVNRVVKIVPPTDGYYDDINIYAKRSDSLGQWGHFPWVTDALLDNPNDSEQLITSATDKGQPCPGADKATIIGHRSYRCTYKNEGQITNLKSGTRATGDPRRVMFNNLVDKFCSDKTNVFKSPGGQSCLALSTGKALAVKYCEVGKRIKGANGGDANCSADLNSLGDNYAAVAVKYCKTPTGRADTFCKCYNITNGVCDAHPTAAGCAKKKATFDKLVAATPSDQKDVWSGMEACFGRVCTGTGVFIPPNANQNCDKSVNICIQDIDIGSMTDSNIEAKCDIDSGDGSPSVSEPSAAQDSAQSELEEAKAALARGDAGAQERVDAAEAALDAADESAGETGPKAYIPKSLDGLKNDRKQQIGAGVMGALVLGCMMMLLLLVVSTSGGGGGPAKRRFR
jgi:hypothetical protein